MIQSLIIFFSFIHTISPSKDSLYKFQLNGSAQGTTYHCTYYANSNTIIKKDIDALLASIDSSLSLYKFYSLINQFNQHPRGVAMDAHMKKVVEKAIEISTMTKGAFDITCKPIIELWKSALSNEYPPSRSQIRQVMKRIGAQHIAVKADSLIKDNPAVQIDCDGIAQGYSVDQIAVVFKKYNINDFLVELGGEIYANGHPPGKTSWSVAIQTSSENSFDSDEPVIPLSNAAITTSGSMNKYMPSEKKKYSHIVHPLKGSPIHDKIIAVTVVAGDAMTADALDNALMVMGVKKAMHWLIKNPLAAAKFYFRNGGDKVIQRSNDAFKKYQLH